MYCKEGFEIPCQSMRDDARRSMHLYHSQNAEDCVSKCERYFILQHGSMSTCIPQETYSCLLTVDIVVDQPVTYFSCSEINKEKGRRVRSPRVLVLLAILW